MSYNSQLIGPFEECLREELQAILRALGFSEADVLVLETSPGIAMIQIIYPFGYNTKLIPAEKPTIFQAVEDFLLDKLCVAPWGFVMRTTHLRIWVNKNSAVFDRLMDLSKSFAV